MTPKERALRTTRARYDRTMRAEEREWRCLGKRRSINHNIARSASDTSIRWFLLYERLWRRDSQGGAP